MHMRIQWGISFANYNAKGVPTSDEAALTGEEHTSSYSNSDEKPFIGVGNILDWLTFDKHISRRR